MTPLFLVGLVLYIALQIYSLTMWGRFILDLVQGFRRGWRPQGAILVFAEYTYTVTDPPIRFVRRLLPPLRLGPVALDFGWSITMLLVIIALYATSTLLR